MRRTGSPHRVVAHVTPRLLSPIGGTDGLSREERLTVTDPPSERLEQALRDREAAEEALRDLQARIDNAQQLAHMGDYDWEIAPDINTWSDELFRISGREPGTFSPT
jgi:hypothetical protein